MWSPQTAPQTAPPAWRALAGSHTAEQPDERDGDALDKTIRDCSRLFVGCQIEQSNPAVCRAPTMPFLLQGNLMDVRAMPGPEEAPVDAVVVYLRCRLVLSKGSAQGATTQTWYFGSSTHIPCTVRSPLLDLLGRTPNKWAQKIALVLPGIHKLALTNLELFYRRVPRCGPLRADLGRAPPGQPGLLRGRPPLRGGHR